jgi:formamidopyrimidine-DNA glycosylase
MPELPEVEIVKKGLEKELLNLQITKVVLNRAGVRSKFPANFVDSLTNQTIVKITRRAKYILCHLSNKRILLIHLGMSGKIRIIANKDYLPQKHDHILIYFSLNKLLIYNDYRRFGEFKIIDNPNLSNLGLEPLDKGFNGKSLYKIIHQKTSPIKNIIMNQKYVVGVGNIYASESLFLSQISPLTIGKKITEKQAEILSLNIKKVLENAILNGGSSLKDFISVNGESGRVQDNFFVYGRAGLACGVCDSTIKRIKQQGRSSFYCEKCQN